MPQQSFRPGSSHFRLGSVKPHVKSSISSGESAAESDSSLVLKAKPVEPVIYYPRVLLPVNNHMDIGFRWRDGDGSCICGRIAIQKVIFDVWSRWKASCLLIWLCVILFLISVTTLFDMIIRLCMCKGRTHHVKVLESKSHCKMANTSGFFLQVTD
jgi:hypothetical protein